MSSEETDTENSENSLSDVSSLDDDFARMQFESSSSKEVTENDDISHITMLQFRESLVRSLLLGAPFENLILGPRQQSTSHSKRKLADHKLKEKEVSTRNVDRQ